MTTSARHRLVDWIQRHGRLDGASLRGDTPLLADGILTSLQIMDLLLLLEELRQEPVKVEELAPGAFRDLDTIVRAFLPEELP